MLIVGALVECDLKFYHYVLGLLVRNLSLLGLLWVCIIFIWKPLRLPKVLRFGFECEAKVLAFVCEAPYNSKTNLETKKISEKPRIEIVTPKEPI